MVKKDRSCGTLAKTINSVKERKGGRKMSGSDKAHALKEEKKVMAVFQGHVHAEHHELIGGIHYLTQLAMVDHEGLENNSFSIVEIQEGQIRIDGFKRVSDQTY